MQNMDTMQSFITCILVASFLAIPTGNAANLRGSKKIYCSTFTVDMSGRGNFTSIKEAINAVPMNNHKWICIRVKAGTYTEKIMIPAGKTFIYLQGEGKRTTKVAWSSRTAITTSPTLTVKANNIIFQGITFINMYNVPYKPSVEIKPAVAAMLQGDKLAFYDCGFMGLQDTLWDCSGRHYFYSCTIYGGVDFIFGAGQSIYEKCIISVTGGDLKGPGFITAHGRTTPNEQSGFVFKGCTITGRGKAYLGRAWRPYARVVFYNTIMSGVVVPQGWNAWNSTGKENTLSFDEVNSSGSGANKAGRVRWANKHSMSQLQWLTSISYIDGSSWLLSI